MSDNEESSEHSGEGKFGDGIKEPLYEFKASRLKGGRLLTPNVIRIWPDRVEEYEHHAIRKKETQAIRYAQVAQIKMSKGMVYAEIAVESTGGHVITMKGVPKKDGEKVKTMLDQRAEEARHGAVAGAPAQAAPVQQAPAAASMADELIKLAKLRDDGILTEEEFAQQKANLMK